jgi:hypothetical protein
LKKKNNKEFSLVAGRIEISNQLISDLIEFVQVVEELINADQRMERNEY